MSLSKIYGYGVALTAGTIVTSNIFFGIKESRQINKYRASGYTGALIGGSVYKGIAYGAIWPIFIPYAGSKYAVLERDMQKFGRIEYDYTGISAHMLPLFMDR